MTFDRNHGVVRMNRATRFALSLGSTLFVLLRLTQVIYSQEALDAYDRGLLTQAYSQLQDGALSPYEADFLLAAMTANADSALEIYRQVVLRHPESPIAKRALDRVRQYYYAQGLYNKAEEIGRTLGNWTPHQHRLRSPETTPPPPFDMKLATISAPEQAEPQGQEEPAKTEPEPVNPSTEMDKTFCLQVGAFSSPANARALKDELDKAGYQAIVLDPSQNPTGFHVVWVTGFKSVAEAFSAAEAIQEKFNLQPIVIPNERHE